MFGNIPSPCVLMCLFRRVFTVRNALMQMNEWIMEHGADTRKCNMCLFRCPCSAHNALVHMNEEWNTEHGADTRKWNMCLFRCHCVEHSPLLDIPLEHGRVTHKCNMYLFRCPCSAHNALVDMIEEYTTVQGEGSQAWEHVLCMFKRLGRLCIHILKTTFEYCIYCDSLHEINWRVNVSRFSNGSKVKVQRV